MPGPISYRRRVAWADTDATGAWMFTAVLRYVEEAEVELFRGAGVLREVYGWLPRIYADARFVRPAFFDDEIEVVLGISRIGETSLHYEFQVHHAGELAAHGRMGCALISRETRAKTPLEDPVRAALEPFVGASATRRAGTSGG